MNNGQQSSLNDYPDWRKYCRCSNTCMEDTCYCGFKIRLASRELLDGLDETLGMLKTLDMESKGYVDHKYGKNLDRIAKLYLKASGYEATPGSDRVLSNEQIVMDIIKLYDEWFKSRHNMDVLVQGFSKLDMKARATVAESKENKQ